ncbi:ATP-binding cassette domain-containing protein [uncultured Thiodictyon sp.]|uniref:ABC transporter ATP-binding protein n=1 Tax=uncultured Thiodictyon sp. TaxID=1846217 RepID=UPI0025ECDD3E|nr:ATP-binding cassette domain-containing protein [uncultured Thiodictyon sp.]
MNTPSGRAVPRCPPLLTLECVGHSFDGGHIVVLRDVSLELAPGEGLAIEGPSGGGKTTLLGLMAGLDRPSCGRVRFDGQDVPDAAAWTRLRAARIGIVFQDYALVPTLTAVENVELAMFGQVPGTAQRRRRARERLAEVGVADCAARRPAELSGGERRRVGIARALANAPALLLADEPTANLDSVSAAATIELLLRLHAERGMALVVVSHDRGLLGRFTRRLRLADGQLGPAGEP